MPDAKKATQSTWPGRPSESLVVVLGSRVEDCG